MSQQNQPISNPTPIISSQTPSSSRRGFNPFNHDFVTPVFSWYQQHGGSYISSAILGGVIAASAYYFTKDSLYPSPKPPLLQTKIETSALEVEFEQNTYAVIKVNDEKTAFFEFNQKRISDLEKELIEQTQTDSGKEKEKIQVEYTKNLNKRTQFYDERINEAAKKAKIAWGWEKPIEKTPALMPKTDLQENINQMIGQYTKMQEEQTQ